MAEDLCPVLRDNVIVGNGPFAHVKGPTQGGAALSGCVRSPKGAGVRVPCRLRVLTPVPQSSTPRLGQVSGRPRPLDNPGQVGTGHRVWGLSALPVPKCSQSVRPLRMF